MQKRASLILVESVGALIVAAFFFQRIAISFLTPLLFIAFDYFLHDFRIQNIKHLSIKEKEEHDDEKQKPEIVYIPNFKIWSLGIILGISSILLDFSSALKDVLASTQIGKQITVLIFFLLFIGFILVAITKILKED